MREPAIPSVCVKGWIVKPGMLDDAEGAVLGLCARNSMVDAGRSAKDGAYELLCNTREMPPIPARFAVGALDWVWWPATAGRHANRPAIVSSRLGGFLSVLRGFRTVPSVAFGHLS